MIASLPADTGFSLLVIAICTWVASDTRRALRAVSWMKPDHVFSRGYVQAIRIGATVIAVFKTLELLARLFWGERAA
jgi:hypothetical protein